MFQKERDYRRKHLRAPFKFEVLFEDDSFVHKARALNISEGGILLDRVPHFPANEYVPLMLSLAQYPYLKNYSLEKLKGFDLDLFSSKVIRVKAKMVRRIGETSEVDNVFSGAKVGLSFTDVDQYTQKMIADYVDVFASNLIYLQVLIDSLHADEKNLEKIRVLGEILGYSPSLKLSVLRKTLGLDYQSLQWL